MINVSVPLQLIATELQLWKHPSNDTKKYQYTSFLSESSVLFAKEWVEAVGMASGHADSPATDEDTEGSD